MSMSVEERKLLLIQLRFNDLLESVYNIASIDTLTPDVKQKLHQSIKNALGSDYDIWLAKMDDHHKRLQSLQELTELTEELGLYDG